MPVPSSPAAGPAHDSQLSTLLQALYASLLEDDPWTPFLHALLGATASTHAVLILLSGKDAAPKALTTPGTDPALTGSYFGDTYTEDPFVGLPEGEVVAFEDFVARETISPRFARYLSRSGGTQILGVDLRHEGGAEARVRLTRNEREAPPFSAAERALLQAIVPHLRIALALFARLETSRQVQSVYRATIERMAMAVFLLARDGRLLRSNEVGRALLEEAETTSAPGSRLVANRLALEPPAVRRELARLLASPEPGATRRLLLRGPRGEELPAIAHVLEAPAFSGTSEPVLALFVTDPARPGSITPEALRDLFQLTAQEAVLAATLADGISLVEAAQGMGIAHNTARAHLRMIFQKTGVRRQAGLVHLLQSIAGIVSGPQKEGGASPQK